MYIHSSLIVGIFSRVDTLKVRYYPQQRKRHYITVQILPRVSQSGRFADYA